MSLICFISDYRWILIWDMITGDILHIIFAILSYTIRTLTEVTFPKIRTFPSIQHSKQTILNYIWILFFIHNVKTDEKQSVSHPTLENDLRAVNRVLKWEEVPELWPLLLLKSWFVVETLEGRFPHQVLTIVRTSSPSSSLVSEKHIVWLVVDMRTLNGLFSYKIGTLRLCSMWEDKKCWTLLHSISYSFLLPFWILEV